MSYRRKECLKLTIDILKLQKIIMKAWDDYNLASSRLDKETVGAFLAVDIVRAEMEPIPIPKKPKPNKPSVPTS